MMIIGYDLKGTKIDIEELEKIKLNVQIVNKNWGIIVDKLKLKEWLILGVKETRNWHWKIGKY